jgi:hypothetical protein
MTIATHATARKRPAIAAIIYFVIGDEATVSSIISKEQATKNLNGYRGIYSSDESRIGQSQEKYESTLTPNKAHTERYTEVRRSAQVVELRVGTCREYEAKLEDRDGVGRCSQRQELWNGST